MPATNPNWPKAPETFVSDFGKDKVNRQYLRFPEAQGHDGDDEIARAFNGDKPQAHSLRRALVAEFVRSLSLAPAGLAHTVARNETLKRALSTLDSAGGYTIPPGFVAELIKDAERPNSLFGIVRKVPVGQTSGSVPRVLSNASVTWGTEGNDIDEGDPAFTETAYAINRLNALAKLTRELVEDSGIDIVGTVSDLFSEAISQERDKMIAIGNGTGKPLGIYSATGIINVAVTALTYENLLTLKYSVDARYHTRPAFRWVVPTDQPTRVRFGHSERVHLAQTNREVPRTTIDGDGVVKSLQQLG